MGVATAQSAPPEAARAPLVQARTPPLLARRACQCGSPAGLSGSCTSCGRTSLAAAHTRIPAAAAPFQATGSTPGPGHDFGRIAVLPPAFLRPQTRLLVSSPGDAAEREAHQIAHLVARTPEPTPNVARLPSGGPAIVHRRQSGAPVGRADALDHVEHATPGGTLLPAPVRAFMEARFGADFGAVRIHADARAAALSSQLSAQAFTVGRDIYFGHGQFQPDAPAGRELIAHELTHTIQQGSVSQRAPRAVKPAPAARPPVPTPRVTARAPASAQRIGIGDAWSFFADQANNIPGFRMLTIVLGVNPLTQAHVDASAANILKAIVEFLPGGGIIVQALQNTGIFEKAGAWVGDQLASLKNTGSALRDAAGDFIGQVKFTDILFDFSGLWQKAKRIFTEPIDRLIALVKSFAAGILKLIKDAILLPLAKLAEGTPSWTLLTAVLGKNPITGEVVAPTADNLIGPFMTLIGQADVWDNMKKSGAIPRAWAWFQGAVAAVRGFVAQLPDLFIAALTALTIEDVVLITGAFNKVRSVFGGFLGRFTDWAGTAIWNLLEIIFDVVSPGALSYIKKTGSALKSIFQNPLPFVGNLVRAAKLGFQNFGANIGTHLKTGLLDWLTGALPGVYIPTAFTLVEVGKLALSVLGITWAQIRGKIVKALGARGELIMSGLELAFDVIVALKNGGPAAAWALIQEKLTGLKDMVISGITSFVIDTIVSKAIPKLISLFIPGAGFISAIVSIYDTVMVFVNKLAKIAAAVKAFVDSIVAIAAGQVDAAAAKVESTLAGLLSLGISFLAGFLGLGNIAAKILAVIARVRAVVDKALDTAIAWVVGKAKALFVRLFGKKDDKPDERTDAQKSKDLDDAINAAEHIAAAPNATLASIGKEISTVQKRYRLTSLTLITEKTDVANTKFHFEAVINPKRNSPTNTVSNSKKRGDHVFALGISKTLQQMQAMTPMISNASLRQVLSSAIESGLGATSSSAFSLTVDKGAQPAVGDAQSITFGALTEQVVFSYRAYLTALERASTSKGTEHADVDSRMLADAKSHFSLKIHAWVASALDTEAVALLPEKQSEIASGQQALAQISQGIEGAVRRT